MRIVSGLMNPSILQETVYVNQEVLRPRDFDNQGLLFYENSAPTSSQSLRFDGTSLNVEGNVYVKTLVSSGVTTLSVPGPPRVPGGDGRDRNLDEIVYCGTIPALQTNVLVLDLKVGGQFTLIVTVPDAPHYKYYSGYFALGPPSSPDRYSVIEFRSLNSPVPVVGVSFGGVNGWQVFITNQGSVPAKWSMTFLADSALVV